MAGSLSLYTRIIVSFPHNVCVSVLFFFSFWRCCSLFVGVVRWLSGGTRVVFVVFRFDAAAASALLLVLAGLRHNVFFLSLPFSFLSRRCVRTARFCVVGVVAKEALGLAHLET